MSTRAPWIHDLASTPVLLIYCEGRPLGGAEPFAALPHTHVVSGGPEALEQARRRAGAHVPLLCSSSGVRVVLDGGRTVDLAGPNSTETFMRTLLQQRRRWLDRRDLTPIVGHSVLSDQRTVALVDPKGS
ncbi:MAG TPA: hypothetical protein PKU91_08940, partial [Phycisphaerales bacterium]|nr:hypothetical protein [Phycisphaerales bacterium]